MRLEVDAGDRSMVLAHYYRAMVGRADVWRTRMDSTTNLAIVATAGIVTFTLGEPAVSHSVVFISSLLTVSFLLLEARRLTFYRFWQRRALLLENTLLRAAIRSTRSVVEDAGASRSGAGAESDERAEAEWLTILESELGRTVPDMPLSKAVARRLRRIYLYLFGVQVLAWGLKLGSHPANAASLSGLVERARIGGVPGPVVAALVGLLLLAAIGLAVAHGGVSPPRRAERPNPSDSSDGATTGG